MPFKIWNDGDKGRMTFVELDGEDVSGKFNSLTVHADLHTPVTIMLDMPIDEIPAGPRWPGGDKILPPRLIFPIDGTRELLIKYGWTPPKEA